jgi:hypothetical protein
VEAIGSVIWRLFCVSLYCLKQPNLIIESKNFMYSDQVANDYHLVDAFHWTGLRLYGAEWTGNEYQGRKAEDRAEIAEQRKEIQLRLDDVSMQLHAKRQEQREVGKRSEIQSVNFEISELENEQGVIFKELNEVGDVRDSDIRDRQSWERFEVTEGKILRTLGNGDLKVYGASTFIVKPALWLDQPVDFGWNFELSLIFWPERECRKRVDSGRISKGAFDLWLDTLMPEVAQEIEKLSPEKRAYIWFKDEVKKYDGSIKRDHYLEMALEEFPGLPIRGFNRIWETLASDEMTKPGPKKH